MTPRPPVADCERLSGGSHLNATPGTYDARTPCYNNFADGHRYAMSTTTSDDHAREFLHARDMRYQYD